MGSKNHVVDGATWQIRDIDPRMADPVRLYATLQLLICSSLPFRNDSTDSPGLLPILPSLSVFTF